jgi:hypothetical protein
MVKWYYSIDGEQFGPVDGDDLKRLAANGTIARYDEVWTDREPSPIHAVTVDGLFSTPPPMLVPNSTMFGPLAKAYEGIDVHETAQQGDVQFLFHTYHGFLVFFIQTEHRVSCPPDDARELLRRLNWFNLTWGMLSYGMVFVPFLSFFNQRAQNRAIARQEATARTRS